VVRAAQAAQTFYCGIARCRFGKQMRAASFGTHLSAQRALRGGERDGSQHVVPGASLDFVGGRHTGERQIAHERKRQPDHEPRAAHLPRLRPGASA
jgi:hypothetical protein